MIAPAWSNAKNILVVRMDNIGDVIMLGPALRALKRALPSTRLTLLASPAGGSAAALLPWIDATITWRAVWQDAATGDKRMPFVPEREMELIRFLSDQHFDAALIFTSFSQTPHTPAYACYLAGIPLRAGESTEFGGSVLTDGPRGTPVALYQVERNLRLVEALGFEVVDRRLEVVLSEESRTAVPEHLRRVGLDPTRPFILLHPGASAQARRYPAPRFAETLRLLRERGWQVVVTATAREEGLISEMRRVVRDFPLLLDETTLSEYAALIEQAALVICNNTLPLHLAEALDTPVLALYSGSDYEEQWRPVFTRNMILRRPTSCHPCFLFQCPFDLPCLDIAPEEVGEAALELLAFDGDELRRSQTTGRGSGGWL